MQPSAASRYHALDALRAAMMFLGIYLHAVVAYSPNGGWPFKPPRLTTSLDYSTIVIHIFRMPVFYVMAGFFAALLLQRYGSKRAIANRFWRIAVPFVVGWIVIYPMVMVMTAFGRRGLDPAVDFILSGRFLDYAHPLHLWFLEYLIVFYVLAGVVVVALPRVVPSGMRTGLLALFRSVVRGVWAPLPFGVLSFLALMPMTHSWLDDPPGFVPAVRLVVAYGIPFGFGWLLFANADLLDVIRRRGWLYMAAAVPACVAYVVLLYSFADRGMAYYALRAAHALAMWCLILGVTGLFLRYLSGHSPLGRYLCDSSYFLYIAHLPVIMLFQLILLGVPLPPLAKIGLALAGTIAVLLPLYHYAVRPTVIGAVLNGRKYPSTLAPAAAA
ncbi:MAG TPA: acyltransferase family protein [Reyranella sp.]|nr:acyltransferase family protein [Reyranella sp.]